MKTEKNGKLVTGRLKEILEESGMRQGEFGRTVLGIPDYKDEREGYSDRYTSEILNGKKNLSRKKAENIVKHYPYLRIEWILGLDDSKTEIDRIFKQELKSIDSRNAAFIIP